MSIYTVFHVTWVSGFFPSLLPLGRPYTQVILHAATRLSQILPKVEDLPTSTFLITRYADWM